MRIGDPIYELRVSYDCLVSGLASSQYDVSYQAMEWYHTCLIRLLERQDLPCSKRAVIQRFYDSLPPKRASHLSIQELVQVYRDTLHGLTD